MKKFDIYLSEIISPPGSHIQKGYRPFVVISNDVANAFSPLVTVVPLTSNVRRKRLPTQIQIKTKGLDRESLALCDQLITVDKDRLGKFLGRINNEEDRTAINRAVSVQLGIIPAETHSAA